MFTESATSVWRISSNVNKPIGSFIYKRETTKLVTTTQFRYLLHTTHTVWITTQHFHGGGKCQQQSHRIKYLRRLSLSHGGNIFKFHLFVLFTCRVSRWKRKEAMKKKKKPIGSFLIPRIKWEKRDSCGWIDGGEMNREVGRSRLVSKMNYNNNR